MKVVWVKKFTAIFAVAMFMGIGVQAFGGGSKDGGAGASDAGGGNKLVLYASTPEDFLNVIVADFKAETGIDVEVVAAGTGELYKRIEAEGKNPLGDVMLGGMVSSGYMPNLKLWGEYVSPNESALDGPFKNASKHVTSFNLVPSVLMINNKLAAAAGVKIEGYEDLLNPALKGKIVIPSPSQTSSGWEHLVNALYAMGGGDTAKGWDYVNKLLPNLKILNGSSATHKGVADGEYIVGLVAEGMVDIYTQEGVDVSKVFMKEGVVINVDGIAIIEGCKNRASAEKFIDFMTSKNFQAKMAVLKPPRRPIRNDIDGQSTLTPTTAIKQIPFDGDYLIAHKSDMLDHFQDLATNY